MKRDESSRIQAARSNDRQPPAARANAVTPPRSEREEGFSLYELAESMSQGVVCLDADEQVIMANAAAQSMLSLTLEQLQQRTPLELPWRAIREDGSPFSREAHPALQALESGQPVVGVSMGLYHPEEHAYRWLSVDAIPQTRKDEYGPYRVFVILQDATSAKRTQRSLDAILAMVDALRQKVQEMSGQEQGADTEAAVEERLAHVTCQLLGCQRVGIALIEPDTENLHPLCVMGLSPEHEYHWSNKLQGVRLSNFLGDPSLVLQLRNGEVLSLDITVPLFQDQVSYKRVAPILLGMDLIGILVLGYEHADPQLPPHERLLIDAMARLASLAIMHAKTQQERDQALSELQETRADLARTDRAKNELVSAMSREVRSALTGIQGFSELMRDADLTAAEMKEFAIDIHSDARRIMRMISDMLDLNRMEEERIELNPGWLDLNAIIVDAVSRVRPTTHSHLIRMQLARALPILLGDREKLMYVVTHLLNNAIKYSPDGGEIVASTALEDKTVLVSIRDHGVGIPAIDMERIFERYARTETGHVIGSKQGLPLVREIVQLHGGQVWVESILGAGSVFHFTLPFAKNR